MRGTRAKKLRKLATQYVVGVMKKSAGEGYNKYNQAMNRFEWEPQLNDDGHPLMVDGRPTMKPVQAPGTLTCAWHVRTLYQEMKKRWKLTKGK